MSDKVETAAEIAERAIGTQIKCAIKALEPCNEHEAPHEGTYHNHGNMASGDDCRPCDAQYGLSNVVALVAAAIEAAVAGEAQRWCPLSICSAHRVSQPDCPTCRGGLVAAAEQRGREAEREACAVAVLETRVSGLGPVELAPEPSEERR